MRAALDRIREREDIEKDEIDDELRGAGQFMVQQVSPAHQDRTILNLSLHWGAIANLRRSTCSIDSTPVLLCKHVRHSALTAGIDLRDGAVVPLQ